MKSSSSKNNIGAVASGWGAMKDKNLYTRWCQIIDEFESQINIRGKSLSSKEITRSHTEPSNMTEEVNRIKI